MSPIQECSPFERMVRALIIIEGIVHLDERLEDATLNKIYSVTHSALQNCGPTCPIQKEIVKFPELERSLHEANIIKLDHIEKIYREICQQQLEWEYRNARKEQ